MRGYIQVYTGDGKGKTTAALGLIVRACGAGLRVYLGQFLKCGRTCELKTLATRLCSVKVEQYGTGCFVRGKPTARELAQARRGFIKLQKAVLSGNYDVVIADECNVAVSIGLIPLAGVLELMAAKPQNVELVLTGRGAPKELIEHADLVTETREIKHYFHKGVNARAGIEN